MSLLQLTQNLLVRLKENSSRLIYINCNFLIPFYFAIATVSKIAPRNVRSLLVSKTLHICLYVKKNFLLTLYRELGGGGGDKALAVCPAKNASFFMCSLRKSADLIYLTSYIATAVYIIEFIEYLKLLCSYKSTLANNCHAFLVSAKILIFEKFFLHCNYGAISQDNMS